MVLVVVLSLMVWLVCALVRRRSLERCRVMMVDFVRLPVQEEELGMAVVNTV